MRILIFSKVIIHLQDDPRQKYYFVYNGWIGKDVGEGVLYRDIPAKKNIPTETVHGKYLYSIIKMFFLLLPNTQLSVLR
jgi:hypothetical protein